jgi:hypothetical protein
MLPATFGCTLIVETSEELSYSLMSFIGSEDSIKAKQLLIENG